MWRVHTDVGVTTNSLSELCQLVTFLHSLSNINASKVVIYLYTLLYCAYSDYLYRLQELFSRQFLIDLLFFLYLLNVKFDCLLCRENLQLLRQRYYYATWKADGTRYMMLITMDGFWGFCFCFFFERVFEVIVLYTFLFYFFMHNYCYLIMLYYTYADVNDPTG